MKKQINWSSKNDNLNKEELEFISKLLIDLDTLTKKKEIKKSLVFPVEKNSMEQKIAAKKVKTFVNVDVNSKSPSLSFFKTAASFHIMLDDAASKIINPMLNLFAI